MDKQFVLTLLRQLAQQNKTGQEIARELLREDVPLNEATVAFLTAGYVVKVEQYRGVDIIHVSDRPTQGLETILLLMSAGSLPAVVWSKKEA